MCRRLKRSSYIFSLILLLAQVLFREEVLTLCIIVRVLSLKKKKRTDRKSDKPMCTCTGCSVATSGFFFLCLFRHIWQAVSPAQWDLLWVRVGVFIAVGAAAVFLRRDVETAHLRSGGGLFHTVHFRAERINIKSRLLVFMQSFWMRHGIVFFYYYCFRCAFMSESSIL